MLPGTVSERSAWRMAGYQDGRKGWPHRKDIPDQWKPVYLAGWAQDDQQREREQERRRRRFGP